MASTAKVNNSSSGVKGKSGVKSQDMSKTDSPFKTLLGQNGNKGSKKSGNLNFKKLLDLLNLSSKELKAKLKEMDQGELKDLQDMVESLFMNILKNLHHLKKNPDSNKISLSRDKLVKLKDRLGYMQQLINNNLNGENSAKGDKSTLWNNTDSRANKPSPNNTSDNKHLNKQVNKQGEKAIKNSLNDQSSSLKSGTQSKVNNITGNQIFGSEQTNQSADIPSNNLPKTGEANLVDLSDLKLQEEPTKLSQDISEKLKNQIEANLQNGKENSISTNLKESKTADILLSELKTGFESNKENNRLKGLKTNNLFSDNFTKLEGINNDSNTSQFNHNFNQQNPGQSFGNSMSNFQVNSSGENNFLTSTNMAGLKTDNTINQIAEQIKLLHKPEQNQIKMQLEPEYLGKVKMNLTVDNGEVSAKFIVDNLLVKNHLDQNLATLRSNLSNQGFNVDQIEVESDNTGFGSDQDGQSEQQQFSSEDQQNRRNHQHYNYEEGYFVDMDPEQIGELVQADPQRINELSGINQNWMTLNGNYQRMNLLA